MKLRHLRKRQAAKAGYGHTIASERQRNEMPYCWGCRTDMLPSGKWARASARARGARSSVKIIFRSLGWGQ